MTSHAVHHQEPLSVLSNDQDDVRETELDAIMAIFPEMSRIDAYTARLCIPVTLAAPVRIMHIVQPKVKSPESLHDDLSFRNIHQNEIQCTTHHLYNLPDITLSIHLPKGYPFQAPPVVNILMQRSWIPEDKIKELVKTSRLLWEDLGHDQVVYGLISQLQDEAEHCFGLAVDGFLQVPPDLTESLLRHNSIAEQEHFDRETFMCSICLEPKKGIVCHRLRHCGHVFCIACLHDFYASSILEGDVENVKCLDPECGKGRRSRKIHPAELAQIKISDERIQRYIKLRKKRKLESNPNTVYCPRSWCQGPARIASDPREGSSDSDESATSDRGEANPEGGAEFGAGNDGGPDAEVSVERAKITTKTLMKRAPADCLAVCTDCSFAFCLICKRSWHGEFGYCSVRNKKIFSREEKASEEYLKRYTTPCPSCHARAQKTMGCNHMICRQCNTHFCYLCSSWLSAANPYIHFNTAGSPCYQKLWELEQGDGLGAPARPEPPPIEVMFENSSEDERDDNQEQEPPPEALPNAPRPPEDADQRRPRRRARQRSGPRRPRAPPEDRGGAELRGHGLQRFLQLAARDEEDGWDSDELEDQFIQFVLMDQ